MRLIGVIGLLLLNCWYCTAQEKTKIWLHTGVSMNSYKGDLSGYNKYTSSFHIGAQLNKKHRVNGSFNLGMGTINGENRAFTFSSDQVPLPSPNRYFKTTFFYVNYDLHVNLIKRKSIIVYISQGIGFIHFSPEDGEGNSLADLPNTREDQETYRQESFMLPTNLGILYLLPNQYGVSVQAGFYNPMTDYLDNISQLGDSGNDNILAIRFAFFIPLISESKAE